MKTTKLLVGLFISIFFTGGLFAQQCADCHGGANYSAHSPSTRHLIKPSSEVNPLGPLGQTYLTQNVCGLNYVTANIQTTTRYCCSTGTGFPTALNVSGLPSGFIVKKAYLYYGASYTEPSPPPTTATVTNPASITNTYAGGFTGIGGPVCWEETGTTTYRVDITQAISGNGTYDVNLSGFADADWEVDGCTIIIIYVDPNAKYSGNIAIWDGVASTGNYGIGPISITLGGFNVTTPSVNASAFACYGDMQNNVSGAINTDVYNGSSQTYSNNFWNCNVNSSIPNLYSGQNSIVYDSYINDGSDCWFMAVGGLYWQNSNCANDLTLNLSAQITNPTCTENNGSATVTVSGGNPPYTYLWTPTGGTNATISGLSAGNYAVNVTDSSGNAATLNVTLAGPPVLSASITSPINCYGESDGSATVTVISGAHPPYTYSWSPTGGSGSTATGLAAQEYTVTVTDSTGCSGSDVIVITQPGGMYLYTSVNNNATCTESNGSATVGVDYGTTPYTYSWNNGETTSTATGLSAGTYTITVTDARGCSATASADILAQLPLTIVLNHNARCSNVCSGNATVTPSGGVAPYTYSWGDRETTQTATSLCGSYYGEYNSVTVTDANGCSGSIYVYVYATYPLYADITSSRNVDCQQGSAIVTAYDGIPPYKYSWSNGETRDTATGLSVGSYTVTVSDSCSSTYAYVTIYQATAFTSSISGNNINCSGESNGEAAANVSGGSPPYTYSWSNGGTSDYIYPISAGTYTVTVTDNCDSTKTETVTITQPPAFSLSAVITNNIDCNGGNHGSATATATGGTTPYYYYYWSNGLYGTKDSNLSAGTYTVTVYDARYCSATATVVIGLDLSVTSQNISCSGETNGNIMATVSAGAAPYTYSWSNGNTTSSISGLSSGYYMITVTDAIGCSVSDEVYISEPYPLYIYEVSVNNNATCASADGSATVYAYSGTTPYTYSWSNGETTATATGLSGGIYTITVTDANNCPSASSTVTIFAQLTVSAVVNQNAKCSNISDGSATVTASGGTPAYTYSWDDGETTQTAVSLSGNYYGDYHTITVTDANGCSGSAYVYVYAPYALYIYDVTVNNNASCSSSDGSATVNAYEGTTPYTYSWSDGETNATATALSGGTFTVTVTDANNCASASSTVSIFSGLTISAVVNQNANCSNALNGSATVTVSGGTPVYTYSWDDGETTQTAVSLSGNYYGDYHTITITDANGCSGSAYVYVYAPYGLYIYEVFVNTNASCSSADGSATVYAYEGTAPYTYSWSDGETTLTATGLSAGVYTITVTDANNCPSASSTVTISGGLSVSVTLNSNGLCNGSDGSATASASGGFAPYTYSWDDGETTKTAVSLVGYWYGSYHTVSVTDANGCGGSAYVFIYAPYPLYISEVTVNSNASCSSADGSATVYAYEGTQPYTYSWSDGETTVTANALSAGVYTITVTDANNCPSASSTVTISGGLSVSVTLNSNALCNSSFDGSATVDVSGGVAPYTYSWNDGETTQTAVSLLGYYYGVYHTITVTDANGCSGSAYIDIYAPDPIYIYAINIINAPCSSSDGSVTVDAYNGTAPYTYSWSNGETTDTATALSAGVYSVTVTDANDCPSVTGSVTLSCVLSVSITLNNNAKCNSSFDGSATVDVSGGVAPYTYLWDDGETTQTAVSLLGYYYGDYHTVTVTDANGNSGSASVYIYAPNPLQAIINSSTIVDCQLGTSSVNAYWGVPPYMYSWSNGETTDTATGLSSGVYSVTVTDSCSSVTVSVYIGQETALTLSITSYEPSCYTTLNGEAVANVSGGSTPYTYSWSNGGTDYYISPVSSGTYTVTVTDNCDSTMMDSVILAPVPLSVAAYINNDVTCYEGSNGNIYAYGAGGSGNYSYVWTNSNATVVSSSYDASGVIAGNYTITVTDVTCGGTATASVSVTQPAVLAISASVTANVSCNGGSNGCASASVSGGSGSYSLSWTNSNATVLSYSGSFCGFAAGVYTVTVADSYCGSATASVTITQPVPLSASAKAISSCETTGTSTAKASGGTSPYTYSWSPSGGTSALATGLSSGGYTVTITDSCGATATASVNVNAFVSKLRDSIVKASVANVLCYGTCTGSATVGVKNGVPPYTYSWSNSQTSPTATGLCAATYTVRVSDFCGNSATASVSITQPRPLKDSVAGQTNVKCNGTSTGSVYIGVEIGASPFTFLWSPTGKTTQTATGLSAGTYTVTVSNHNGCTNTLGVTVTEPPALSVSASVTGNVSCYKGNDGSASATPSGGTPPYVYSWTGGGTNSTKTGLSAGTYTIKVRDNCQATATASVTITQPSAVRDSVASITYPLCNKGTGSATIGVRGGVPPYTYSWSPNVNITATASSLTARSYTVTVEDNNNCSSSVVFTMTQPSAVVITMSSHFNVQCYGGATGNATANRATGGTSPYTYSWSPSGGNSLSASNLGAGNYTITATDNNGCAATAMVSITQPPALTDSVASQTNEKCNGANTAAVSIGVEPGASPFTFSWSPSGKTTQIATGLSAGIYMVTVANHNGCSNTLGVTITQPPAIRDSVTSLTYLACAPRTGTATIGVKGGIPPYTYDWMPNVSSTATATGLTSRGYTVTVKDANGCSMAVTFSASEPGALRDSIVKTSTANVSCNGTNTGSATVGAKYGTAPYTFLWSPGGGTNATDANLSAGTYSVSVTDNNGCTATASVNITQPTVVKIIMSSHTNVLCYGGTGSATANAANGGTYPYSYSWSPNGGNSLTASSLSAGTYTITATDSHGCTATATVIITQPKLMTDSVSKQTNVKCNGGSTGSVTIGVSGGVGPFTYLWSPSGITTQTATGLSAGIYAVSISNHNGCSNTLAVTVTQPAAIRDSVASIQYPCYKGGTGSATIGVTGGVTPYTYAWSGNTNTTATATGLGVRSFTVTVKDNNGCSSPVIFSITQPVTMRDSIVKSATVDELCYGASTGSATVGVKYGTPPYTYSWAPSGGNSATATGLGAGIYTVTVSTNNGCTATASVSITQPKALRDSVASQTNEKCNGSNTAAVNIGVALGASPFTFLWSPTGKTTQIAFGLSAGAYTVTVTNHNGCSNTLGVTVTQPAPIRDSIASSFCNDTNNKRGMATVGVKGGTSPYTYSWSPGGGSNATMTGLSAGTYTITVKDNNGCTGETLTQAICNSRITIAPPRNGANNQNPDCCPDNVNLYPNPNTGQFTISGIEKGMIIEVYDYTGKCISNITTSDNTMQINLSTQANGMYLLRIISKDGNMVSQKKVVKTE